MQCLRADQALTMHQDHIQVDDGSCRQWKFYSRRFKMSQIYGGCHKVMYISWK